MTAVTGPLLPFLGTGNYLFFWPVYGIFHTKETQRRQALFRLFLLEFCVYAAVTGSLLVSVYRIPDFHHGGFLLAELTYLVLVAIFWVATYGAWSDSSPDEGWS